MSMSAAKSCDLTGADRVASGAPVTPESVKQPAAGSNGRLEALGAVELGRVSTARNAMPLSIDQAKLLEVKRHSRCPICVAGTRHPARP